jgi:hypothetical protein
MAARGGVPIRRVHEAQLGGQTNYMAKIVLLFLPRSFRRFHEGF